MVFTLVRHGAYATGGDPAFETAVEVCEVTPQQAYLVRRAGGVVFDARDSAVQAAQAANAPKMAQLDGHFSSVRVGGAEVYIPR